MLLVVITASLHADDGAASIAAGGIVVMKQEPRIVMAKEVLQISAKKVIVDYDFRNDSDADITTEVAFPIPGYSLAMEDIKPSAQGFDDFRLWIDGDPARYQVEARAFLKDAEYTELLRGMHVDVASFGHATSNVETPDIRKLTANQRQQLEALALIDHEDGSPLWMVKKTYHWQQAFPARKTVHIRHEYSPVFGSENSVAYGLGSNPDQRAAKEIESFCLDGRLRDSLSEIANSKDRWASYSYVDFILTTANTWKTPIEDFTLIVERPHWKNNQGEPDLADYVSFCWDGPITKIDGDHFSAHTGNLVPAKELRVGFFSVEHGRH
jgi:hypothetical protein